MKMTKQMSNRYQNNCAKWIQVTQTDDFTTLELLFQIKSFKVKSPLVWTLGKDTQFLEIKNGRQDTTFSLALLYGCTIQLNTSYSPLLFCVSLSCLGYDNMEVTEVAECDIESWPCVSYWVFFIMQATSWCWCMAVISPLSAITHKSSLRFGSVPPSESLLGFISVPSTCTATQPRNSLEIVSWYNRRSHIILFLSFKYLYPSLPEIQHLEKHCFLLFHILANSDIVSVMELGHGNRWVVVSH